MKIARVVYKGEILHGRLENGFFVSDKGNKIEQKEVKLIAPVTPSKIIAVGLNYRDHIEEMGHDIPASPVLFSKFPQCVIGPGDEIIIPEGTEHVDYEAELAVVISKQGFKIPKEEAAGYVLGATCLNDVTYRKIQRSDGQWTRAKNYPSFCPVGPVIDTEADYDNCDIQLELNGELKQSSNTNNFLWNVEELIEFISAFTVLFPGDIITTGTTSGVGPMYAGDKVQITIEGIGTLVNYVIPS
jgi:2-keto-4-pentenoate hydratase/2-oxohepta-3-ene-1,7-dioic acid hydratase in catechol pathway